MSIASKLLAAGIAFHRDPEKHKEMSDRIKQDLCPECGKDPKLEPLAFDPQELQLSGLCDECWDKMFKEH